MVGEAYTTFVAFFCFAFKYKTRMYVMLSWDDLVLKKKNKKIKQTHHYSFHKITYKYNLY